MSVCDIVAGASIIRAEFLDHSWLDSINQCEMTDIRSASESRLKVSGTIILNHGMRGSRTRVTFGTVKKLVLPVGIGKTYINSSIKLIRQPESKSVLHHSPPVPILMVH